MFPTLTDGKTTLEPDFLGFHPLSSSDKDGGLPLEAEFVFGPLRQRLRPYKGVLWWGGFPLADQLRMTVHACKGAALHLRILDREFRVLEELRCSGGEARLKARVRQSGLVFFHLANEGERDELLFVEFAHRHCGELAPRPPLRWRGLRWLRELRRSFAGNRGRWIESDSVHPVG